MSIIKILNNRTAGTGGDPSIPVMTRQNGNCSGNFSGGNDFYCKFNRKSHLSSCRYYLIHSSLTNEKQQKEVPQKCRYGRSGDSGEQPRGRFCINSRVKSPFNDVTNTENLTQAMKQTENLSVIGLYGEWAASLPEMHCQRCHSEGTNSPTLGNGKRRPWPASGRSSQHLI